MAARQALPALAVVAFVVACDGDTQTQPPPTSTTRSSPSTTTTNPALPTHGAPRVTDPLDAETFADNPAPA